MSETPPGEKGVPIPYRALLRLYPADFRDAHGRDFIRTLQIERAEGRIEDARFGALRFWMGVLPDTLKTAAGLRLDRLRGSNGSAVTSRASSRGRARGISSDGTMGLGEMMMRDFRHAARGLIKNPGYTFVFVLTLGLGIGANTAMFSAVNAVLLKPLPHQDGDRLVYLRQSAPLAEISNALFSVPEIDEYRQGAPSLAEVAEFSALTFTMLGHDEPRRVRAGIVTGNYFGVMGLNASVGRMVGLEDDGENAPPVIVLSDRYWRNAFGADPGVLGTSVEMNGRSATIVGVAEPAPPYPERTDIYVNMAASPHHLSASMNHDRQHRMTEVFARLAPEASPESAANEVTTLASRIHADHPEAYDPGSGYTVSVTPLKSQLTSRARPTLLMLLGTATMVLIIACANLANLTFTRVLRRNHELAVRISLGGTRGTLRRGLLAESLILAVLGAGLGLGFASVSLQLLIGFAERFTSRAGEIALDANVFGFALLVAVAASLFFTILPALPKADGVSSLTRSGARHTLSDRAKLIQRSLVVAQIASSFVLLMGAGLLVRTMIHLSRVDPGYDTAQILTMDVPANTAGRSAAEVRSQFEGILTDVEALPGVESVALTSAVPLSETSFFFSVEVDVEDHDPLPGAPEPRAQLRVVSEGFFETMGIDLVRGREFTTTDVAGAQEVVVINESMARAYFGDRNPIGERIAWNDELTAQFLGISLEYQTVVGVAADVQEVGLDGEIQHTMYNSYGQVQLGGSLVVRLQDRAETVMPSIREVILSYDSNQPIDNVATLEALGAESVAPQRLNTILLGAFAILALVIASVGIGGVLAFSVGSRTREFGVRSALGAASHQIWGRVLGEGATLAGIGLILGVTGAAVLTRFLGGLLVDVQTLDPITFIVVAVILSSVAIGACAIPALRAASVSPMESLSSE